MKQILKEWNRIQEQTATRWSDLYTINTLKRSGLMRIRRILWRCFMREGLVRRKRKKRKRLNHLRAKRKRNQSERRKRRNSKNLRKKKCWLISTQNLKMMGFMILSTLKRILQNLLQLQSNLNRLFKLLKLSSLNLRCSTQLLSFPSNSNSLIPRRFSTNRLMLSLHWILGLSTAKIHRSIWQINTQRFRTSI